MTRVLAAILLLSACASDNEPEDMSSSDESSSSGDIVGGTEEGESSSGEESSTGSPTEECPLPMTDDPCVDVFAWYDLAFATPGEDGQTACNATLCLDAAAILRGMPGTVLSEATRTCSDVAVLPCPDLSSVDACVDYVLSTAETYNYPQPSIDNWRVEHVCSVLMPEGE